MRNGKISKLVRCVKCNSSQTYTLKDGTTVCRTCGERTKRARIEVRK